MSIGCIFPDRDTCFYRVGWYDNIMGADRMSLYVELGYPSHAAIDEEKMLARVLEDLKREQVITTQKLISKHSIVLDPAYVHVNQQAQNEQQKLVPTLNAAGIYPVGRYGAWTYCSIEDNMLETQELARRFAPLL